MKKDILELYFYRSENVFFVARGSEDATGGRFCR